MQNLLQFNVPFSGFTRTDFLNCFTSTYMFLENITGNDDYDCAQKRGEPCNGCGNCHGSTSGLQERQFFLFDTMSGRSSLRCRFDGEPTEMQKLIGETDTEDCGTDYTTEFLLGFAGYEYRKLTDPKAFADAIKRSIDAGKPVIAKMKNDEITSPVNVGTWPLPAGTYDPGLDGNNIPDGALLFGLFDESYNKLGAPDSIPGLIKVASLAEFASGTYYILNASSGFSYIVASSDEPVNITIKAKTCRFRVIIGYDGDLFVNADYKGAQNPPKLAPTCDEMTEVYIISNKTEPRYTLKDGLERIIKVMEFNISEKLWDSYIPLIGWFNDKGMNSVSPDERSYRMKRAVDTMWHTFNCHNFAEVFRYRISDEMREPIWEEFRHNIGGRYGYTHDLAWGVIALNEWANPKQNMQYYLSSAEIAQLALIKIKENDEEVLKLIKQALEILKHKD